MDARKLEEENMWQVSWDAPKRRDPRRWATVALLGDGTWYITNENLRPIKTDGALGKKIVAAVAEMKAETSA